MDPLKKFRTTLTLASRKPRKRKAYRIGTTQPDAGDRNFPTKKQPIVPGKKVPKLPKPPLYDRPPGNMYCPPGSAPKFYVPIGHSEREGKWICDTLVSPGPETARPVGLRKRRAKKIRHHYASYKTTEKGKSPGGQLV